METSIFSPYLLFFTDQEDKIWSVLRDGRIRFVKEFCSFPSLNSSLSSISGVRFVEDYSHILKTSLSFDTTSPTLILKHSGYVYYPTLLEAKKTKLAVLNADLLNIHGQGDLIIYQKAKVKFHPIVQMPAKMASLFWNKLTEEIYFISARNNLVRVNGEKGEILASNVQCFCLNPLGTKVAYYDGEVIHILSLISGNDKKIIAFDVKALGFDKEGENLFFSTSKEDKYALYSYVKKNQEVRFLLNHSSEINLIIGD